MITPIILSGGNGTRLWPLSRTSYPKQYLPLTSKKTLLQETALRVATNQFNKPMIICNNEHRFIVREQLQDINIVSSHIVLETKTKNTAPAVAISCLLQEDLEQLLLILPADHIIKNLDLFYNAIETAKHTAQQGKIITFGITPKLPETRYGYIERGEPIKGNKHLFKVKHFVEKPNLETAKSLLKSGMHHWNSGIFLFKAKTMLEELERLQPALLENCRQALLHAKYDLDFLRLDSEKIKSDSSLSIDYAVMEHTNNAAVIPVDLEWSDLGSWDALWDISEKDHQGNIIIGDVIAKQVNNSYIHSDNKLISILGLNNIIAVVTEDAVLISSKEHINQIKDVVQKLKEDDRTELDTHKRVYRPWGYYQTIDLEDRFQVKRIMIKPGAKISTQIHYHRAEHWVVVEGTAKIIKGEEILILHENESIYLPIGIKHSVENPGKIPLHLIEVQSGSYLGEDDIVRIEDMYGRVTSEPKLDNALNDLVDLEKDARNFGFNWPHKDMIIEQAISECNEIKEAILKNEPSHRIQEEIGDLLHTAISLCIFAGYDTKQTLAKVTQKFNARMHTVKALTKKHGLETLNGQPIEFLIELWKKAKKQN